MADRRSRLPPHPGRPLLDDARARARRSADALQQQLRRRRPLVDERRRRAVAAEVEYMTGRVRRAAARGRRRLRGASLRTVLVALVLAPLGAVVVAAGALWLTLAGRLVDAPAPAPATAAAAGAVVGAVAAVVLVLATQRGGQEGVTLSPSRREGR